MDGIRKCEAILCGETKARELEEGLMTKNGRRENYATKNSKNGIEWELAHCFHPFLLAKKKKMRLDFMPNILTESFASCLLPD